MEKLALKKSDYINLLSCAFDAQRFGIFIYLAEMQNVSFTICLLKNKVKGVMELRILGTHWYRRSVSLQKDSPEGTADL